ncbi:hypothetical protein E3O19_04370 [Cryobacterium algoritolerans]|uniref:Helicase-associated domain-containing protein n=2 Tax=Cryobacterium algoritolerans TaxID=1259184 RepID=A0A4V3IF93_9MICO|nr:hypothetical protein E3O19_04370 [Cryobacterium algoritolerans]
MQLSTGLQALHAEYAVLSLAGKRSLSGDQARSITFYRAELAFIEDPRAFAGSSNQIVKWIWFVQKVESFVAANGRLPRQNNRLAGEDIDRDEWDLAEWVRYRQGRAASTGRLCDYQRRRLACIPGYREHPRESNWDRRLEDYRSFIEVHRRAPRYRSEDGTEKSLAGWGATQRAAYLAATLSPRRIRRLEQLQIWVWGRGGA